MNAENLFNQLKTLRDTLKLRSHLFELELKDEWQQLEKKAQQLEAYLIQRAQQLGVAEKHYFVGSDKEIESLVAALNELNEKTIDIE